MMIVMIPLTFDRPLWLVVLPSIITFVPPVRKVLGPPLQDLWLAALQLANQPIWTTNKKGAGREQERQRERGGGTRGCSRERECEDWVRQGWGRWGSRDGKGWVGEVARPWGDCARGRLGRG